MKVHGTEPGLSVQLMETIIKVMIIFILHIYNGKIPRSKCYLKTMYILSFTSPFKQKQNNNKKTYQFTLPQGNRNSVLIPKH